MKKILHLTQSAGGVKFYIKYIIEYCNCYDHILIAPYRISKARKNYFLHIERVSSLKNEFKYFIKICKIVKQVNPDIIHAHSSKAGCYGRVIGLLLNKRVVYTPNAFYFLRFSGYKKLIIKIYEKLFSNLPHYFMASSPSEEKRAINEVCYSGKKILTGFYNSIHIDDNVKKNYSNKNINLLFVGRFTYQKNPLMIIDVLYNLNKMDNRYFLTMIGSGFDSELDDVVRQKIKYYKIENNINIIPWMERKNLLNEYKNHDIFVLTSRYESFGYVTCEALAHRLPVVSTKIDGSVDLIVDGYNGYLVENKEEMINKINYIANDLKLIKKMGINAREYILKNYNIELNISKLNNNYKMVINSSSNF